MLRKRWQERAFFSQVLGIQRNDGLWEREVLLHPNFCLMLVPNLLAGWGWLRSLDVERD